MEITDLYADPDWTAIAQGVRLSWNSGELSDTKNRDELGDEDYKLLLSLTKKGASHRKFLRMAPIHLRVRAPLYWWKQFVTYKVGTVSLSSSTMHTLQQKHTDKPFSLGDFATPEDAPSGESDSVTKPMSKADVAFRSTVKALNKLYAAYQETKNPILFNAIVRLMPCGYLQTRLILLNYEVARAIYHDRKNHILPEWRQFCEYLKSLPYSEFITGGQGDDQ